MAPHDAECFGQIRVTAAWRKYSNELTWGKDQCLAILDDGCDLSEPQWQVQMAWGRKVIAAYNSIDGNDDPAPVPPGYHGTTVGNPSSLKYGGVSGIAYNNFVAHIRCVTIVHLHGQVEAPTMARALQWVLDNHRKFNITAVNLSPLDDERHREPVPTPIDEKLALLRERDIWVSAPCGNHDYTDGISWPACQPDCFGIGAAVPGKHEAHLDRWSNTDLLVAAPATSTSNAYAAACAMVLREAIEKLEYRWQDDGPNLPEALMRIFKESGVSIEDRATGCEFRELDLLAALDHVFRYRDE